MGDEEATHEWRLKYLHIYDRASIWLCVLDGSYSFVQLMASTIYIY
jgi:hypothetical protein